HRQFDATLPLVGIPDGVVEAKLDLLLDVARKVIGRNPAGVNIECGFATVRVTINDLKLDGVPGRAGRGTDEAALAGRGDAVERPVQAEGEVDKLEVMHRDVGAGIAAANPLGELGAADRFWLQEGAIAVVDVLEYAISDQSPEFLVVGVDQL